MAFRRKQKLYDMPDVDTDGIATSQTPAAGGTQSLTLDGALTSNGSFTEATTDMGRQISITSSDNDSARTFVVTGTDPDGYDLTESITGPNTTTVESTDYFRTVTSITIDGDSAGAITVGTVDELRSKSYALAYRTGGACLYNMDITGTINYTVQETFEPPQQWNDGPVSLTENALWVDITNLDDETADATPVTGTYGATAFRVEVNSYSSGAEAQLSFSQPYIDV